MRNKTKKMIFPLLIMGVVMFLSYSCKKDDKEVVKKTPILTTAEVTKIGQITALSGGVITSDEGFAVTERGVCWNTTGNPTVSDTKTTDELGVASFTSKLTGLTIGTTYYLRAYATNSEGTAYGNTIIFETLGETFTDSRDGSVYKMVTIGDQIWMAENLKYLPSVVGPATGSQTTPYYYVYGYNGSDVNAAKASTNYTTYGVLYNWTAACNSCPAGWHLPSDAEWTQMENYLADNGHNYDGTTGGGRDKIAKSLASTSGWDSSPSTGVVGNTDYPTYRNKSGFTTLPGGGRSGSGSFRDVRYGGCWWSATERFASDAWYRYMFFDYSNVYRDYYNTEGGFSVRCVRD